MHLSELKALHVSALLEMAISLDIDNAARLRKQELMFAILKKRAKSGEQIFGDGALEVLPDGFGFLRSPDASYMASTDDIYISPSQIRRFNLHTGDSIEGEVRTPKDGERYFALVKVDKVNGEAPEASKHRILFENLTPLHPNKPLLLEREMRGEEDITGRIIDLIAPIGKGQRGLLVASPKSGKSVILQHIAHAITTNHPEAVMIVLLIDERPEEVTEMQRSVRGEVVASTFDEPATRHVQVAEMVLEKAKRLVEMKKDVVILLDSITRLARAYNTVIPASGKVLTGGVEGLVFATPYGKPLDPRRDHELWERVLVRAGVADGPLHGLRHDAASLMVATGSDISIVQTILGHTDIRTTRGYVDIANEIKKQAVEKVAAALFDGGLAALLQPSNATMPRQ